MMWNLLKAAAYQVGGSRCNAFSSAALIESVTLIRGFTVCLDWKYAIPTNCHQLHRSITISDGNEYSDYPSS